MRTSKPHSGKSGPMLKENLEDLESTECKGSTSSTSSVTPGPPALATETFHLCVVQAQHQLMALTPKPPKGLGAKPRGSSCAWHHRQRHLSRGPFRSLLWPPAQRGAA